MISPNATGEGGQYALYAIINQCFSLVIFRLPSLSGKAMTSHKMFGFCRAGEEWWENGNKMGCIGIKRGHLCHYSAKQGRSSTIDMFCGACALLVALSYALKIEVFGRLNNSRRSLLYSMAVFLNFCGTLSTSSSMLSVL